MQDTKFSKYSAIVKKLDYFLQSACAWKLVGAQTRFLNDQQVAVFPCLMQSREPAEGRGTLPEPPSGARTTCLEPSLEPLPSRVQELVPGSAPGALHTCLPAPS